MASLVKRSGHYYIQFYDNSRSPSQKQRALTRCAREGGLVVRTIFLLEYISTGELRRRIPAATTKIESYNAVSDWLGFGGNVICSGDPVEQEKRVKYRVLVENAVTTRPRAL